jgi:hypothetical protein
MRRTGPSFTGAIPGGSRALAAEPGELSEEDPQRFDLRGRQRREQVIGHRHRRPFGPLERPPPLRGEVNRVLPPVVGVGPALGEAHLLELVDHRHHRAGVDERTADEIALGGPRVGVDQVEDPEVTRQEPEGLERPGEEVGGALAVPREQEARGAGERLWRGAVEAHGRRSSQLGRSVTHITQRRRRWVFHAASPRARRPDWERVAHVSTFSTMSFDGLAGLQAHHRRSFYVA